MWSSTVSMEIHAPPDAIFAYLADFTRHGEWSNIGSIKLVRGENGQVGAEYEATENIPVEMTTFARITEIDPPRVIVWEATDKKVFRTNWTFEIQPLGEGARLVQSVTFHPLTPEANEILNVYRVPYVEGENLKSLEAIKARLEKS
jgi:hypothetical protein